MTGPKPELPVITVAYLVNLYPKISHSFIRREIQALESQGVRVQRYAIRRTSEPLVDDADCEELAKTEVLLELGPRRLFSSLLRVAARHPFRFLRVLSLAARTGVGSDRGLARHMFYVVEACALLDILRRDPVDHVHAHFGTNAAAAAMYCAALGGPGYSFTAHGTESFDSPHRIRLGLKAKRARFAVTVCEYGRRELIASAPGIDASKVHVVRCGLDEAFLSPPTSAGVTGKQLVLVGRLSPEKGHEVLMDAADRLQRDDVDFQIVLVGDGELRSEIERRVATLGLDDRIHFAGWQDHAGVQDILSASRALVLASFGEGLPVVIMEAMAMGRPIVSTDVGGISELVVDGETGWLVPSGDSERLAEAMRLALEASDTDLAAMGQRGRERVLRMHDVGHEAAKLKELFERYALASTPRAEENAPRADFR
jgi:colanic acid/amylovoran biosynthesis glycosyltransferase